MANEGRHRRDAVANREAVLDAATEVLRENPDATMSEIARQAGLGRTTVYRHFASHDELVEALVSAVADEAFERITEIVAADPGFPEVVRATAGFGVGLALRYPFLYDRRVEVIPALQSFIGADGNPYMAYIAAAQERGELRSDQSARWYVAVQTALTIATIGDVLAGRLRREEAADALADTLMAMATAR